MPNITLEKATKIYKKDGNLKAGVENIDLTIEQGEFVFLVGSSGAGKSTLLSLITGSAKPDRGAVYLDGRNLRDISRWERSRVALTFGQVRQESQLIRRKTVEENLEIVARIGRKKRESRRQRRERIRKVLGLVGMSGVEDRYPVELSGGECRRVELARALINSPSVLVLDEITANLDEDNAWDIFLLLNEINRKGTTIIMATHASSFVDIMRRRVVTIVDGHVFADVEKGRYTDQENGLVQPDPEEKTRGVLALWQRIVNKIKT